MQPASIIDQRAFVWNVRVYYEDTDSGGVVYYANYLKFLERARTEWLRARGVQQQALAQSNRLLFVVKQATIEYHAPARLDDELQVTVLLDKVRGASLQIVQHISRIHATALKLLTTAHIKVACIDADSGRPVGIPECLRQQIG